MRNSIKPLVPAILLAMTAAPAFAVDFSGYVRSGIGVDTSGGGVSTDTQYEKSLLGRLGNEFDTYSELGLGQDLYNQNGKSIYFQSLISMESNGKFNGETTANNSDTDTDFGIQQLNMQAKGYIAAMPDAVIWAGKRFYQREDLHIIDTKYYNVSGYGAGVENMKMGQGALSAAWIRGDQTANINFLDVRYAGLKPWAGSWAQIGFTYAMTNPTDDEKAAGYDADDGVMVTAEVSQSFGAGYNKTVLQYGSKGMAQNMISQGGGWYDDWSDDVNSANGYRLINTGEIKLGDKVILSHVLTYGYAQDTEANVDDNTLLSFVVRPEYVWNDSWKTALELGYFQQKETYHSGSDYKTGGNKVTVAQILSAGSDFFARPEIRFYATYIADTEDNRSFNDGRDNNTFMFGAQVEAWW